MSDRDREKRRRKKLAKQKIKRKDKSRPGRDLRPSATGPADARRGLEWPPGPCWLSDGWHERGATVHVVLTRVESSGAAIAGLFEVDLHRDGVRDAKLAGGLSEANLPGVAANISEAHAGITMVEVPAAQAAAVLVAGVSLRAEGPGAVAAREILGDLDPADAPIDILTGAPDAPRPPRPEGWFSKLVGKLVASP